MTNTLTLCPELDKLRNKELSFWCYVYATVPYVNWTTLTDTFIVKNAQDSHVRFWKDLLVMPILWAWNSIVCESDVKILGHPLTRGRIYYVYKTKLIFIKSLSTRTAYGDIQFIFNSNPELYDQNELQRMLSPHREKLKELLIQFAYYF